MTKTRFAVLAAAASLCASVQAQHAGQLNVIGSVQAEWRNMIQTVFARTTGIKLSMSLKGCGESLAQLIAEKANPKTDVWFGGTGDPHLQAAEMGLTLQYKSPALTQLFVAVRPEAWRLAASAAPSDASSLSGTVQKCAYLGKCQELTADTALGSLFVVCPDVSRRWQEGEPVQLSLGENALSVVAA
jgi:ABC-type thiamine transport system substrate-binding protein